MYVKIFDTTAKEGSKLLSDIKDIYKSIVLRNEACVAFDSTFIDVTKEQPDIWKLYITNHNGNSYFFLAEIGSVFIMNDDGKTIDRF